MLAIRVVFSVEAYTFLDNVLLIVVFDEPRYSSAIEVSNLKRAVKKPTILLLPRTDIKILTDALAR